MKLVITMLFFAFLVFAVPGMAKTSVISEDTANEIIDTDDESDIQAFMDEEMTDEDIDAGFAEEPVIEIDEFPDNASEEFPEAVTVEVDASFPENDNFNDGPVENPMETETGLVLPSETDKSGDKETSSIEKNETHLQETIELNNEYDKLSQKRVELDQEFQALEEERKKLIAEKDGLKKKEDILSYNKRTDELNLKIKKYDEEWKAYDQEVQGYNIRTKKNIEKTFEKANQDNIETNYESFNEEYETSFREDEDAGFLKIDPKTSINDQRTAIEKHKNEIDKESQALMKEKEIIQKDKKLVKNRHETQILNEKTKVLNEKIIKYGRKRTVLDQEIREFNKRLEKQEQR